MTAWIIFWLIVLIYFCMAIGPTLLRRDRENILKRKR